MTYMCFSNAFLLTSTLCWLFDKCCSIYNHKFVTIVFQFRKGGSDNASCRNYFDFLWYTYFMASSETINLSSRGMRRSPGKPLPEANGRGQQFHRASSHTKGDREQGFFSDQGGPGTVWLSHDNRNQKQKSGNSKI